MNNVDKQYFDLVNHIIENGIDKGDRTGTGTRSIFGYMMRFNLAHGLPLLTTKRVHFKSVAHELIWLLSGDTNVKYLQDNGVKIWDQWALKEDVIGKINMQPYQRLEAYMDMYDEGDKDKRLQLYNSFNHLSLEEGYKILDEKNVPDYKTIVLKKKGDLGRIYGKQFRDWRTFDGRSVDQISNLINDIKTNPESRRHIVSAWNPGELDQMALPPCHAFFQFYLTPLDSKDRYAIYHNTFPTKEERIKHMNESHWYPDEFYDEQNIPRYKLSCMLTQRSADTLLGLPFNIASYSLLTHMIAHQCNLVPGELIWSGGDVHIYSNHMDLLKKQLTREPYNRLPKLKFNRKPDSIFGYKYDDLSLEGYESHPNDLKGPVAV